MPRVQMMLVPTASCAMNANIALMWTARSIQTPKELGARAAVCCGFGGVIVLSATSVLVSRQAWGLDRAVSQAAGTVANPARSWRWIKCSLVLLMGTPPLPS